MRTFTDTRTPDTADELWLLEHPPVFTLGQAGKPEHVLAPGDIPLVQTDRGGQVTYHGPGQLTGYCLIDLRRLDMGPRAFVEAIEDALVDVLVGVGVGVSVVAEGVSVCTVDPNPTLAIWSPTGQFDAPPLHVSCHVSAALSMIAGGVALTSAAPTPSSAISSVVMDAPAGSVHNVCPELHDAPPVKLSLALGSRLPLPAGPPVLFAVAAIDVNVRVSSAVSESLLTTKWHL